MFFLLHDTGYLLSIALAEGMQYCIDLKCLIKFYFLSRFVFPSLGFVLDGIVSLFPVDVDWS